MRIIRDPAFIAPQDRGAAAAIGNFDGVHLGHQAVIDLTRDIKGDAPLGIVTFEPHPRAYFNPEAAPFRLMNAEAKANRLEKLGVQRLYQVPFNDALAATYATAGISMADVYAAFESDDFTTMVESSFRPPDNILPVSVANICTFTFMCDEDPVGPDIHPTNAGYSLIAQTMSQVSP